MSNHLCVCVQDTEEALMMNLRDSHILNHKQNLEWNWLLIATILKVRLFSCSTTDSAVFYSPPLFFLSDVYIVVLLSQWPNVNLRNNKDEQMHK